MEPESSSNFGVPGGVGRVAADLQSAVPFTPSLRLGGCLAERSTGGSGQRPKEKSLALRWAIDIAVAIRPGGLDRGVRELDQHRIDGLGSRVAVALADRAEDGRPRVLDQSDVFVQDERELVAEHDVGRVGRGDVQRAAFEPERDDVVLAGDRFREQLQHRTRRAGHRPVVGRRQHQRRLHLRRFFLREVLRTPPLDEFGNHGRIQHLTTKAQRSHKGHKEDKKSDARSRGQRGQHSVL